MYFVKIDIIFSLMSKKGITAKTLSEKTGISPGNISDWKNGRSVPKADTLIKLADYFGVSTDYLLGRTSASDYENIKVALSEVFNQDNMITRYVCHLWEALSETYAAHLLLENSFTINAYNRKTDYVITYKQCVVTLCETAKIITLDSTQLSQLFSSAREFLINSADMRNELTSTEKLWEEYGSFFKDVRNLFVHFDHERGTFHSKLISEISEYDMRYQYNIWSDFEDPISLKLIAKKYKEKFPKTNAAMDDAIDALKQCLNSNLTFLNGTLNYFWNNYTGMRNNVVVSTIGKNDYISMPELVPAIPLKLNDEEKQIVLAYRNQKDKRVEIKRLLGVSQNGTRFEAESEIAAEGGQATRPSRALVEETT